MTHANQIVLVNIDRNGWQLSLLFISCSTSISAQQLERVQRKSEKGSICLYKCHASTYHEGIPQCQGQVLLVLSASSEFSLPKQGHGILHDHFACKQQRPITYFSHVYCKLHKASWLRPTAASVLSSTCGNLVTHQSQLLHRLFRNSKLDLFWHAE